MEGLVWLVMGFRVVLAPQLALLIKQTAFQNTGKNLHLQCNRIYLTMHAVLLFFFLFKIGVYFFRAW